MVTTLVATERSEESSLKAPPFRYWKPEKVQVPAVLLMVPASGPVKSQALGLFAAVRLLLVAVPARN